MRTNVAKDFYHLSPSKPRNDLKLLRVLSNQWANLLLERWMTLIQVSCFSGIETELGVKRSTQG